MHLTDDQLRVLWKGFGGEFMTPAQLELFLQETT